MQLRQIGELKLLREIRKRFSRPLPGSSRDIVVGIGDDAAVIAPQKETTLVTTDLMSEGVHFDLSFTSPYNLGFKLVSVNVSDIMAMGGRPRYLFLDLAMKKGTEADFFWRLFDGISAAMGIYGVRLLGGDLSAAVSDMMLSATLLGSGSRIIRRSGAKPGNRIYVTGTLGDSACGLEILKRSTPASKRKVTSYESGVAGKKAGKRDRQILSLAYNSKLVTFDFEAVKPLLERHLAPTARDSSTLVSHATSMIDVSDGLLIDLCRVCDENRVGARIYSEKIPVSSEMREAAETLGIDPLSLAMSGGEDYELLFTASDSAIIPRRTSGCQVTCIGEITERGRFVVDKTGRKSAMKIRGYQHFGSAR